MNENNNHTGKIIWIVVGVSILWVVVTFGVHLLMNDPNKAGLLGDSFGAVNALFSALAFAFIIYSSMLQREELRMQRQELKLQRDELEMTRGELKRSADIQEKSYLANYFMNAGLVPNFKIDNVLLGKQLELILSNDGDQAKELHLRVLNMNYEVSNHPYGKIERIENGMIGQLILKNLAEDKFLQLKISYRNSLDQEYYQLVEWKPSKDDFQNDYLSITKPIPI